MTHKILTTRFNTHKACIKYLEKVKWNNQPTCPYCRSGRSSKKKDRYTCLGCKNSYSVTVRTIFESSKIPLNKWFYAIYLIVHARKGISSAQLAQTLNIAYNSACYLRRKIQAGMTSIMESLEKIIVPCSHHTRGESMNSRRYRAKDLKHIQYRRYRHLKKLFSRSVFGTFHQMSEFYAQFYFNELKFVYKTYRLRKRDNFTVMEDMMETFVNRKIAFM